MPRPADGRIISRAIVSNTPAYPKKLPIVLIATLATLLLSTGLIVTGELLRMTAPRAVAVARGAGGAGAPSRRSNRPLPSSRAAGPAMSRRRPVVPTTLERDRATGRNACALPGSGARKITVLGTAPGESITLTTLTLARLLARDARVVVVDLAGSSPTIAAVSVDPIAPGLAELMQGEASFSRNHHPGQAVARCISSMPAVPASTAALLQSPRLTLAIDALLRVYDHVLLDAGTASDLPAELLTGECPRRGGARCRRWTQDARKLMCDSSSAVGFSEVTMLSEPAQPSRSRAAAGSRRACAGAPERA